MIATGLGGVKARKGDKGDRQPRMTARTSSRRRSMSARLAASRFSRSRGSVFDGRTLKCQSS